MNFELDTLKNREKFTDHDGVVRFLKSQKIKSYIYIYIERERERERNILRFAFISLIFFSKILVEKLFFL